MSEKSFQHSLVREMRKQGAAVEVMQTTTPGFPDLIVVNRGGLSFVECKFMPDITMKTSVKRFFKVCQFPWYVNMLSVGKYDNIFSAWKVNYADRLPFYCMVHIADTALVRVLSNGITIDEFLNDYKEYYTQCDGIKNLSEWILGATDGGMYVS